MSSKRSTLILFMSLLVLGTALVCNAGDDKHSEGKDPDGGGLVNDFYKETCPRAEQIVEEVVLSFAPTDAFLGAKLLRLHYHDCFVRGCDGSILLDTPGSEKEARPNRSLQRFDVIDAIKTRLEEECPDTVSCADILALAARDSVFQQSKRLRRWEVLTGRKDGRISLATDIPENLPSPFSNYTELMEIFVKKGLDNTDLVVLSGAHTVGVAHCGSFSERLYNFTGQGDSDPSIDPAYFEFLKQKCPSTSADPATIVEMDPGSSTAFGNHYYETIQANKGLFQSDAALLTNKESVHVVKKFEKSNQFFPAFIKSMKRMGAIELLLGNAGEIRKNCRVPN